MVESVECLVVGAGAVGLAVARALAQAGREVVILERHRLIGSETSSRNSEVIHAGIYYPTGSLKARACVAGKQRLYAYCASHGVAHRRCGKLIVACDAAERQKLAQIKDKAAENGVTDLTWLDPDAVAALEPEVACTAALLSPSTGIVDSHGLMLAYLGDAEAAGAMLALDSRFAAARRQGDGWRVEVEGAAEMTLDCRLLVNTSGLGAVANARRIAGLDPRYLPRAFFARGHYFSLSGRAPFQRLVYPVPVAGGLGTHYCIDLGGKGRFGPDVEWLEAEDEAALTYDVDPARGESFYAAVRRYWPGLADGALEPDYAGIRPKIAGPSGQAADFRLDGPAVHGLPGLVNLFGIESPGLTASLALAEAVVEALAEQG